MVLEKIPNLNCLWFKKLVEFQEKKTYMVQWLISKTFNYMLRRNFHGCSTLGYLTQFCSDEIYSFFDSKLLAHIIFVVIQLKRNWSKDSNSKIHITYKVSCKAQFKGIVVSDFYN